LRILAIHEESLVKIMLLENIRSLSKTIDQKNERILKAVLGFAKTGLYPLSPDVFGEMNFILTRASFTVSATEEMCSAAPSSDKLVPVMKIMYLFPAQVLTALKEELVLENFYHFLLFLVSIFSKPQSTTTFKNLDIDSRVQFTKVGEESYKDVRQKCENNDEKKRKRKN
jgi:hypothetical protein